MSNTVSAHDGGQIYDQCIGIGLVGQKSVKDLLTERIIDEEMRDSRSFQIIAQRLAGFQDEAVWKNLILRGIGNDNHDLAVGFEIRALSTQRIDARLNTSLATLSGITENQNWLDSMPLVYLDVELRRIDIKSVG